MKSKKMFHKTGVDITNDKSMFEFLKGHFRYATGHFCYATLNNWNGSYSIANCVKVHKLGLSGDCWAALDFLEDSDYVFVNAMIHLWEEGHEGYKVGFNGRSGGYLVLYNAKDYRSYNPNDYRSVLPDFVEDCEDYDDYKAWCKEYGTVKGNRPALLGYVMLVQDFDDLCDEIRGYVDDLSNRDFVVYKAEDAVNRFCEDYCDDLVALGSKCPYVKAGCYGTGVAKVEIDPKMTAIKAVVDAFEEYLKADGKMDLTRSEYGYIVRRAA